MRDKKFWLTMTINATTLSIAAYGLCIGNYGGLAGIPCALVSIVMAFKYFPAEST